MSAVIVLPLLALLGRRRRRPDDHLDTASPEVLEAGRDAQSGHEDDDLEPDDRLERSAREQHELVKLAREDLATEHAARRQPGQDVSLHVPKASDSPSSPVPESILAKPLVESPKMMDKSLPYCLPYHATGPKMPGRAVTIDEGRPKRHHPAGFHFPTLHDHAKEGRTPLPSSPRRPSWPRRVASGWSTFRADLVRDWERRHDPEHVGFWSRAWDVISLERWARKERERIASENQGRNGDPDWIPPKYRWTPILSGVLVPFSILLEIPGLTEHWYVKTIDNVPVVYQSNPALLDVALGISLACAVVANAMLLIRFMEKHIYWSTVVAICALTVHDAINVVALIWFGVIHAVNDGFTYSEAYWLVLCSSVTSVITNGGLIYDFVRTKDFKRSGSGLTPKQRSLVMAVMILLVYMGLGSLVFSLLIPDLTYQDSLYFVVVSIETIGFGDIAPSTTSAKIFWFFYEPLGILNLAVAVSITRDTLLESWEAAYRRRSERLRRRLKERKRQKAEDRARHQAIERQLLAIGAPLYVGSKGSAGGRHHAPTAKLNVSALSPEQLEQAELEARNEISLGSASAGQSHNDPSVDLDTRRNLALQEARRLQDELASQSVSSEEGYKQFIDTISAEEKREKAAKFGLAFSLFIAFWIVGAGVYHATEKWSYFIAFYFCMAAFLTVGYGDYYPTTPAGKAFFLIWAILGVATMTLLISVIGEAYETSYKRVVHKRTVERTLSGLRRERTNSIGRSLTRTSTLASIASSAREPGIPSESDQATTEVTPEQTVEDAAHEEVMGLPYKLLDAVSTFHQHVHYFVHPDQVDPPEDLRILLEGLCEQQKLSPPEKDAVLSNPHSRKVMFMMSYERTLQSLIEIAETAIVLQQRHGRSALLQAPSTSRTEADLEQTVFDDAISRAAIAASELET